jgi:hypothetical protein
LSSSVFSPTRASLSGKLRSPSSFSSGKATACISAGYLSSASTGIPRPAATSLSNAELSGP